MKSILLIGLGRFGKHCAMKLNELHHEVLAIDMNEERVNEVLPYVTNAQIGDSTNEQFIASLGVRNFDVCIVAIGDKFQSSLETTSLLKDYGALLRNGADNVVYPEKQMASWAAVRFSADNIFDYIQITRDYSIYETKVPKSWIGKTIVDLRVRQMHKINILAVKYEGRVEPLPGPDHVFRDDETILVMGGNIDLEKFLRV